MRYDKNNEIKDLKKYNWKHFNRTWSFKQESYPEGSGLEEIQNNFLPTLLNELADRLQLLYQEQKTEWFPTGGGRYKCS